MNFHDNGYFDQLANGSSAVLVGASYDRDNTDIAGNELIAGGIVSLTENQGMPFLITATVAGAVFTGNSNVKLKFEAGSRASASGNAIIWKEVNGLINDSAKMSDQSALQFVVNATAPLGKSDISSPKVDQTSVQFRVANFQDLVAGSTIKVQTIQALISPNEFELNYNSYFRVSLVASITGTGGIAGNFAVIGQFNSRPVLVAA